MTAIVIISFFMVGIFACAGWFFLAALFAKPRASEESSDAETPRRCKECGYDLRASNGRCPECGAEDELMNRREFAWKLQEQWPAKMTPMRRPSAEEEKHAIFTTASRILARLVRDHLRACGMAAYIRVVKIAGEPGPKRFLPGCSKLVCIVTVCSSDHERAVNYLNTMRSRANVGSSLESMTV